MSRFFSEKYADLAPYVPGEQPQNMKYTKLNTNENPFPSSEKALVYAAENTRPMHLYSDPENEALRKALADTYKVPFECITVGNGSDELLNFAFMAFCGVGKPAVFPDVTYGFYPVFASLNGIPYREIPLEEDLSINVEKYLCGGYTVFIANPNAPTGQLLSVDEIEKIVAFDPDRVVVVDEAYIDFGGESSIRLAEKYNNILVIQTFSKSRSMAGARLGFAVGSPELISDLNTLRYSTNPYNVNSYTAALGVGTLADPDYTSGNCGIIVKNRDHLTAELRKLGFEVANSYANFVFAKHPKIGGGEIYSRLKENGVLVRHFTKEKIKEYNRITVGTEEQIDILLSTIKSIWGDVL